jgi:hypothetical protein
MVTLKVSMKGVEVQLHRSSPGPLYPEAVGWSERCGEEGNGWGWNRRRGMEPHRTVPLSLRDGTPLTRLDARNW